MAPAIPTKRHAKNRQYNNSWPEGSGGEQQGQATPPEQPLERTIATPLRHGPNKAADPDEP